jgi:hypothetical protein
METHVKSSELFQEIVRRSDQCQLQSIDPIELQGMLVKAVKPMADLLNRTCTNFPDYTLHDESHALRVIFLMHRLLPVAVLARLSVIDLSLLILSAYAHDIGMAIGREERDDIENSQEYKIFLLEHEKEWEEAERVRQAGNDKVHKFLTSQLFQNYLRKEHHRLSAKILRKEFENLLVVDGKSLLEPVIQLCVSHGEPIDFVMSLNQFPFAGNFRSDLPFLACVLRLADYLDLDPARAPESLLRLIKPETEKNKREWRKHQSNNFFVNDSEIHFKARFTDFFEEKALRDTLKGIDVERRDCMEFLRERRTGEKALVLNLSSKILEQIESDGYIYAEFQFTLEYKEILSLLMGTRLYRDERAFMRELIQNSLDACRSAEAASKKNNRPGYAGNIAIKRFKHKTGEVVIEVTDNGAGMTRSIINDYFMRVGRSYYRSFAFRRKELGIHPISQFGIGILSCFMVGDYIEVETCPDQLVHADAKQDELRGLKLEIRGPNEFFVVKALPTSVPGTTIRIFLKKPLVEDLAGIVTRFLGRCPFKIEITEGDQKPVTMPSDSFEIRDETDWFVALPGAFGYASRDLSFDGEFGFGLHGTIRFYMLETENRRYLQLKNAGNYSFVGFNPKGETLLNPKQLTEEVQRNANEILQNIRALMLRLPSSTRPNVETILRYFDDIVQHLRRQHTPQEIEILWTALKAQVDALKVVPAFNSSAASVKIEGFIHQAISQIDSFVGGQIKIAEPRGILTQDGIRLSSFFHLPTELKLGIGHLFNLDFSGQYRLSLNAARDAVLRDDKYLELAQHLYVKIGAFLGEWFASEKVPHEDIEAYYQSVPRSLAEQVHKSLAKAGYTTKLK